MELKYGKPALDYNTNFAIFIGKKLKIFLPYQSLTRKEREAAAVMKTRQLSSSRVGMKETAVTQPPKLRWVRWRCVRAYYSLNLELSEIPPEDEFSRKKWKLVSLPLQLQLLGPSELGLFRTIVSSDLLDAQTRTTSDVLGYYILLYAGGK